MIRCISDNTSNMQGHIISGVATQIQNTEPSAIRIHCLAHCTNLCLQTMGRKVNVNKCYYTFMVASLSMNILILHRFYDLHVYSSHSIISTVIYIDNRNVHMNNLDGGWGGFSPPKPPPPPVFTTEYSCLQVMIISCIVQSTCII